MQYFSAGTLVALFMRGRTIRIQRAYRLLLLVSGMIFWFAGKYWFDPPTVGIRPSVWAPSLNYFFVLLGCLCIFFGFLGLRRDILFKQWIDMGKISYGLYVYHAFTLYSLQTFFHGFLAKPLFLLMGNFIALGVTISIAKLSYRWLESPFLKLKERFTFVRSREI
jgi:peptidoglycan/LPS O-acetylase OafA/YrhL